MIYYFDEIASTIDEARDPKYVDGDVVVAEFQTAGRGQRGHKWSSAAGVNLTFSVVLDTSYLLVAEQFMLLQAVALALADTFARYGLDARIKWTNDIYVGDRKITGVLIDHTTAGAFLSRSGVGVGINVNQTEFDESLPNPTSMALELGREVDRSEVLQRFYECLTGRLNMLRGAGRDRLLADYRSRIYRLGVPARYVLAGGEEFAGVIRGVSPTGELTIENQEAFVLRDGNEWPAGEARNFLFKEVNFVI